MRFGGNKSVKIAFWLECAGDTMKYGQQSVVFTLCSLKLTAEGPTSLYDAEKEFKCKIEQKNTTESIDFDKVEIKTEIKRPKHINIKILDEGHTEFKKLSGATLKTKIENQAPITFTIQPDTAATEVEFLVTLIYNRNIVDELTFFWATVTSRDAFEAIRRGDTGALKEFIQNGLDINASGKLGETPLTYAVQKNSLGAVKLLLEKGAKLGAEGSLRDTPLLAAVKQIHTFPSDILELLVENASLEDINAQDSLWGTPLNSAILLDNIYALRLLLEKGADTNQEDKTGNTPLYYVIQKGSISMTELLLAHGAEVNRRGGTYPSMLHLAVAYGKKEMIALLIKHGADKSIRDSMGQTLLQFAQSLGRPPEILDLLKDA